MATQFSRNCGKKLRKVQKSAKKVVRTTAYKCQCSIVPVTMALSCVVSEIFNVEKCPDLEIGVKGHSRSLSVVSFDRLYIVSY